MLAALLLSAAVLAGMAFMAANGAPARYPLVNGGALALALAVIAAVRPRDRRDTPLMLAAAALLWLPLFLPGGIDGVARWIALGPIRLHTGFLAVPMLIALVPRVDERFATATVALAALALACQPDRASALAMVCGLVVRTGLRPGGWSAARLGLGIAALGATLMRPDPLAPVPFVENVFQDAWAISPAIGFALALPMGALAAVPEAYRPLAAVIGGFVIASLFGAYPTPLIGYGAASILGFGLAIAAIDPERE